jgi:predicted amidohydrolase
MDWGGEKVIETLTKYIFKKKMNLKRIERYIAQLPDVEIKADDNEMANGIKIAAVQREIKPVKKIEHYIDAINCFIAQASKKGCRLIVFPEYNFFDLFGFIPGFELLNNYLNKKAKSSTFGAASSLDASRFTPIFKGLAVSIEDGVHCIFSLLAKKYGIYVYTGSFLSFQNQRLLNIGFLYGPDGSCVGSQVKLHLTDFEQQLGLARGDSFKVHQLDIGKLAFPICMDATYFETFYAAVEMGADLIILPIANMEEYSLHRAIRGIWGRVQESYVYGIKASLNGWLAGMHFTGKAGVFAPLELTDNKDGVLAVSSNYQGNELVTCCVDYQKLRQSRRRAEYYGDHNPYFEENYVEKTYFMEGKDEDK